MHLAVTNQTTLKSAKVRSLLCTVLLLLSLLLHTVDMQHAHPVHSEHPEHGGSGEHEAGSVLTEYLHMGSNKFVFVVANIFTLPYVLPPTSLALLLIVFYVGYIRSFIPAAHRYIFWQHFLFSRGILNPKLF